MSESCDYIIDVCTDHQQNAEHDECAWCEAERLNEKIDRLTAMDDVNRKQERDLNVKINRMSELINKYVDVFSVDPSEVNEIMHHRILHLQPVIHYWTGRGILCSLENNTVQQENHTTDKGLVTCDYCKNGFGEMFFSDGSSLLVESSDIEPSRD